MTTTLVCALLAGCSGTDDPVAGAPADTGTGPSGLCGVASTAPGTECATSADCPDAANQGAPQCSNCPPEALASVCAAGACVPYDRAGSIDARFQAPGAAEGGLSYVTAVIDPITADGRRLDCANLLTDCDVIAEPKVNVVNVQIAEPVTPIQRDFVYTAIASAHIGPDRLVLVYVTSRSDGEGRILAQGCAEGLDVTTAGPAQAPITLVPY